MQGAVRREYMLMPELTAAILAGGQSSRMGTDKAFVTLDDRSLIQHMLDRLAQVDAVRDTILIANRPDDYAHLELPTFTDRIPGKGTLGGIYTALVASQRDYVLVLACDMPLISPALLTYMAALCDSGAQSDSPPYDVIVPRVDGYPQGVHAIYSARCIPPIAEDVTAGRLKVIGFYDQVRVRYLDKTDYAPYDPHGHSFFNVNTPDDLDTARRLMADA